MTHSISSIFHLIKTNSIKFIDFRFSDMRGKFHHIIKHVNAILEQDLLQGILIDSSYIEDWETLNINELLLKPDLKTACHDPFAALPTLILICDLLELESKQPHEFDPRSTAKKATLFLLSTNIADKSCFSVEMQFFIFDSVRYAVNKNASYFYLDSVEGDYNSGKNYDYGNHGHRTTPTGAYLSTAPSDTTNDLRGEIVETLINMGLQPSTHYHGISGSQAAVNFKAPELITACDNIQYCKYVVHNTAASYNKTATFMPYPVMHTPGSGMYCSQSLWKNNTNLFANNSQQLSQICSYYIGGILKHVKALNAFTNPITNSYKRLRYSLASDKYYNNPVIRPVQFNLGNEAEIPLKLTFPDAASNAYYGLTAILMAGLDGIINKILPQESLAIEGKKCFAIGLCGSLEESLDSLEKDNSFLTIGAVFTQKQIDHFIQVKRREVEEVYSYLSSIEFKKYYTL